ncbi:nicotinate phosphoribosyltransferase [Luteimonas sp. M1R5S18]|jgi:nicotinate phosphoribosyltransferase|uniref:Nicotinate phosphoribosyltransferase n=1 Tax=Luteimonas rhizosphaericola TaxID=3042024 RepID=A0ABT6JKR9_9GAMM|nr:nicotinate phosphoribosyltransferase [Luteimonas rhizosphaericola]MDH5831272.1 nicotinate phosphoribosyltransferase [Luteimonas rhizosphaericola]
MPVIESLLDTDLYKFTMMQAVLHQHPAAHAEYRFRCRTPGVDLAHHVEAIDAEIDALCTLRLTDDELAYLRCLRFIKPDFVDFLALFRLQRKYVSLRASQVAPGEIELEVKGPWLHTILFEVPLLAIVNEVHFRDTVGAPDEAEGLRRLQAKLDRINDAVGFEDCRITDFGTRRRWSRAWHDALIPRLVAGLGEKFAGTSNVDLARRHGLVAQGTMAHEWLQAWQALGPRLRDSQVAAFEGWAREYRGDLGIALTDVIGLDAFLRDFDMYFCKLFDGMRHDSGDPVAWGERMIAHLHANKVDPRGKVLVFSDGLDIDEVMRLYAHFRGRCLMSFGVGTNLTNDLGPSPLSIVMKMVRCNGQPVAKLSDTPGKTMCDDPGYLAYLRQVFEVPAPETAVSGSG